MTTTTAKKTAKETSSNGTGKAAPRKPKITVVPGLDPLNLPITQAAGLVAREEKFEALKAGGFTPAIRGQFEKNLFGVAKKTWWENRYELFFDEDGNPIIWTSVKLEEDNSFRAEACYNNSILSEELLSRGLTGKKAAKEARAHIEWLKSDIVMKAVLRTIPKIVPESVLPRNTWDRDHHLLNTPGGVVNLKTGERIPHDVKFRMSKVTRGNYIPLGEIVEAPNWGRAVDHSLPEEDQADAMLKFLSYGLTGFNDRHDCFFWIGEGGTGKSLLSEAAMYAAGDYWGVAPACLLDEKSNEHPVVGEELSGKRMIVISETREGFPLNTPKLKALTGDGSFKYRPLYKKWVTEERTAKLMLISNAFPRISDPTSATARRIKVLPFIHPVDADKIDTDFPMKLRSEADAILTILIRHGIEEWKKEPNQRFAVPASIVEASKNYQDDENPIIEFVAAALDLDDPEAYVARAEILAAYNAWANDTDIGSTRLRRRGLYERVANLPKVGSAWRNRVRVFTGLQLNKEWKKNAFLHSPNI